MSTGLAHTPPLFDSTMAHTVLNHHHHPDAETEGQLPDNCQRGLADRNGGAFQPSRNHLLPVRSSLLALGSAQSLVLAHCCRQKRSLDRRLHSGRRYGGIYGRCEAHSRSVELFRPRTFAPRSAALGQRLAAWKTYVSGERAVISLAKRSQVECFSPDRRS